MEPSTLPLLGLPISTPWKPRGAGIDELREIDPDLIDSVLGRIEDAYANPGQFVAVDFYVVLDALYYEQLMGSGVEYNNPKRDWIKHVLWALKDHHDTVERYHSDEAWQWWGGPPDDDRWWAHLWEARDRWEEKRTKYAKEERRDYGRVYKRWHIDSMNRIFGSYDFKREEKIDRQKVGERTHRLVGELLRDPWIAKAFDASRPTPTPVSLKFADAILTPEELRRYNSGTEKLSELTVRGQSVWKQYDVPRHKGGRMLLIVVNL